MNESVVWWLLLGSRVTAVVVPRKQQQRQPMHMLRLGAATCNNLRNYLVNSYLGDWGRQTPDVTPTITASALSTCICVERTTTKNKEDSLRGTVQIHSQLLGAAL